ncbi:MAG: carboxyl transferase domain-containing protein [Dehalococcoidales bacterium]|nr:carboxyl transferase domain-containing protein [Dehalococcoidales bacterium]
MSWQKEVDELQRRRELGKQMGGAEGITRQHSRGKLTIRERIDLLLDRGSLQEAWWFVGGTEYDENEGLKAFTPSNKVMGYGKINGRPVCFRGDDFTLLGGSSDRFSHTKPPVSIEEMAQSRRVPMIKLLDGAGGSVREVARDTEAPAAPTPNMGSHLWNEELTAQVPVVSAVLGSCGGWVAITAVMSHWSVMTKNSSELFVAGPPLVKAAQNIDITKQELGNYKVHVYKSGVIDNLAENEEDAFRQIRLFLSYLPQNVWQLPPRSETKDDPERRDEELLSIIPRDRKKQYDIHRIIKHVVDKDSIFELSPFYGRSLVTLFARMDGYPVAIMANDCKWDGGAQTAAACDKMTRFVDMADTFHLPVIYLMDVPGFMIGPESEKEGTLRRSARALFAVEQATVPYATVILRRSYGVAASGAKQGPGLNPHYAWPSAESGSLPPAGGVMAAFRREIEAAPDPEAKRIEIENRVNRLSSVMRRANTFGVMDIIDPRETRTLLCNFVRDAQEITATQLGPKSRIGIRP